MRRILFLAMVIVAAFGAVLIAVLLVRGGLARRQPPPLTPATGKTTPPEPVVPQPSAPTLAGPVPMQFTREGLAGRITQEVERVIGPENAQVAIQPREGGRWVCILADARERYFELDRGLRAEDFPILNDGGFQPPPPPVSRTSASIYRSVAKRAMGYNAEHGDRILILLCPRSEWPKLALCWPLATAAPPQGSRKRNTSAE